MFWGALRYVKGDFFWGSHLFSPRGEMGNAQCLLGLKWPEGLTEGVTSRGKAHGRMPTSKDACLNILSPPVRYQVPAVNELPGSVTPHRQGQVSFLSPKRRGVPTAKDLGAGREVTIKWRTQLARRVLFRCISMYFMWKEVYDFVVLGLQTFPEEVLHQFGPLRRSPLGTALPRTPSPRRWPI